MPPQFFQAATSYKPVRSAVTWCKHHRRVEPATKPGFFLGLKYSPDQPRDADGRFGSGGEHLAPDTGGGTGGGSPSVEGREWHAGLPKEQQGSLKRWLYAGGYKAIKAAQLKPEKASAKALADVANLEEAFKTAPRYDGQVVRGLSMTDAGIERFKKEMKVGSTFTTKCFTSATDTESGAAFYQAESPVKVTMVMKTKDVIDLRDVTEGIPEIVIPKGRTFKVDNIKIIRGERRGLRFEMHEV